VEAVRLLGGFGRRYAAAVRLATLMPIGAIALLRPAPGAFAGTLLAVVVAVAWTGGYCWWLARGQGRTGALAMSLDVTVLIFVYLSVLWTDAVAAANTGWLRLLITFACVTWQWHTSLTTGLVAAAVAGGAASTLIIAGDPTDPTLLSSQMWAPGVRARQDVPRRRHGGDHLGRGGGHGGAVGMAGGGCLTISTTRS